MIRGVGVDLVACERFEAENTTPALLQRLFLPAELELCADRLRRAECLAARFAAKEAFVKALGTGMGASAWFSDLEVVLDERGAPSLRVSGRAQQALSERQVEQIHLSLSHSTGMAVAVVVLEGSG